MRLLNEIGSRAFVSPCCFLISTMSLLSYSYLARESAKDGRVECSILG